MSQTSDITYGGTYGNVSIRRLHLKLDHLARELISDEINFVFYCF